MKKVAIKCEICDTVTTIASWNDEIYPCPKCSGKCKRIGNYVEAKQRGALEPTFTLPTPPRAKPPLGAKPTWVALLEQIQELSSAIERHVNDGPGHAELIKKWAEEVLILVNMLDRVRR